MNSELEALAARKQLLVARASLQRLEAATEIARLRDRLQWSRSVGALASSTQVRSLVFAAALFALRRSRFLRVTRWAGIALTVLRFVRLAVATRAGVARPPGASPSRETARSTSSPDSTIR